MARIGFIGLGNMGAPMAGNLVKAGHAVKGFDLVAGNVEKAVARGVAKAASAADAAREVDVVVTMLPAGTHVLAVWSEALAAAAPGTLFVDSSTIDVDSARAAHAAARGKSMLSLDAPVSGGVGGAEGASLTFMAGGSTDAFAKAEPMLHKMGKRIIHCGEAGAGQVAKLCNNMVLAIAMIGTAEAMTMGQKLGLSPQVLFDVMSTSSGSTWALTHHCPVPGPVPGSAANNGYKPGFAADLMLKDLTLSQEAARTAGTPTPLGASAMQLYRLFVGQGNGASDYAAIIRMIAGRTSG
ncbi:MAG: 3-hydroxyisobutyrate dehydrogenase [Hyphomicrobiaceae bacterium]